MSSSSTSLSSSSSPSSLHATKVLLACLILNTCMPFSCGSAIPIWEFLSRNEKMSYLYSTFAQLVSIHCKATFTASPFLPPVNQCKHNLLSYGYDKLQTFSDHQLDTLDPYQRGANKLIWTSIMRDHPSAQLITTRKPLPTPPISSIIILTHQQKVTNNGAREQQQPQQLLLQTSTSSSNILDMTPKTDDHRFNKNPMFDHDTKHQQQYSMDMDMAYGYPSLKTQDNVIDKSFQEHQEQRQQQQQQQQHQHQHHEHQNRNHQPQELFDTTSTTTTDNNQQQHSQHYHDYQYGKNPMFEADAERLHQYAMDMDAAYGHIFSPKQTQQLISHTREQQQQQQQQHQHPIFLTGPSVIRVRPDGTPVEEDRHKPLPRDDDDFEDYYVSHATSSSYDSSRNNNNNNNNVKPAQSSKQHKKIATISALIQQQLGALAQEAEEEEEEEEHKQRDQIQSQRHQYNNPVSQPPMALHNDYHSSIKN